MKSLVVALVLFCTLSFAQTAKVIQLSPKDAQEAKDLHENLKAMQKVVDDFDQETRRKYTANPDAGIATPQSNNSIYFVVGSEWKTGWESGMEYSDDWQFIVPKPFNIGSAFINGNNLGCGTFTIPAGTPTPFVWSSPSTHRSSSYDIWVQ